VTIVYFDCSSGISANMVFAALVDAGADPDALRSSMTTLPLGALDLDITEVDRGGLRARQVMVRLRSDEPRRTLADVEAILREADLSHAARDLAMRVYQRLAQAEARVHGSTPAEVTFHEVGSAAAIVAVAGTAVALDLLGIDRVVASPVATGTGTVRTEHGVLPVPTPATLELLKGIPVEPREVTAELVTPTGAAILAAAAKAYGPMPPMTPDAVGYGAGPHLLPFPNVLRAVVGRSLGSDEGS
jgi:uncharacterized protein (TIGR00299 family) protein